MTTPFEQAGPQAGPGLQRTTRAGRKLGPVADGVGSTHRAWLEPMRHNYMRSGRTLHDLSRPVMIHRSKLSELLRGIGLYPRWEIVFLLSRELNVPYWPLYRLWRQAAFEARKTSTWVEKSTRGSGVTDTHGIPPLAHGAFRELAEDAYGQYAQVFIADDERCRTAVSDTFDILWLRWNDALASPDARSFGWQVLRATVMSRTPHLDGRPELAAAAFDTVALRSAGDDAEHLTVLEEMLELFTAISRLPEQQFDVMVLRHLCGMEPSQVSALLGVPLATVGSDERHARRFLETLTCPPPETEGTPT